MNIAVLLDHIRSTAQLGLNYSKDEYDRARYAQLLTLASHSYAEMSGLVEEVVLARFREELGHVTPKVGINAALFDDGGRLLLSRRADDGLWELPGGWVDAGESPQRAAERELHEELAITARTISIIDVFSRMPGDFGSPHTSCHLLFHCEADVKNARTSSESIDFGFFSRTKTVAWHRDHGSFAERAWRYFDSFVAR